jgi:hypothetical protein
VTSALFVPEADGYRATDYCRGPWSPDTLHGGPVVGLLAHAVEDEARRLSPSLRCSRLTIEMHQPVPLGLLTTSARVVKPGRRSAVIDSEILTEGVRVARATSQWLAQPTEPSQPAAVDRSLPERPVTASDPRASGLFDYPRPGFNCEASELRYVEGSHETPGPGVTWIRLRSPVVDGRATSPFVRAATVSDLAAAAGWDRSPTGANYINPDVTLHLARDPRGPWLMLDAHLLHGSGSGLMTAGLADDQGSIGHILQSLVEVPRQF